MFKLKRQQSTNILAINFNNLDEENRVWKEKRDKKMEIYRKYTKVIEFLEMSMEFVDECDKKEVQKLIRKTKRVRNKFSVDPILGMCFDLEKHETPQKKSRQKALYRRKEV